MLVLAIDSSSDRLKLGLADKNTVYSSYTGPADRTHSEKIIGELDKLLSDADISPSALDLLAIASGPGSFTGLRIGMAVMLGLSKAWDKRIVACSNQILERAFFKQRGLNPAVVITCRGDQFYYSATDDKIEILSVQQIAEYAKERLLCGPGTDKIKCLLGEYDDLKLKFTTPESYCGADLATLFARSTVRFDYVDPDDLQINYLLGSQAEMNRDKAASGS